MSFKATDFKCLNKKCGEVWEELVDTQHPEEKFECPKCKSKKNEVQGIGLGTGTKKHVSWSQWNR